MENYSLTTIDSPQIPRITIFFKITIEIDQDPIWAFRRPRRIFSALQNYVKKESRATQSWRKSPPFEDREEAPQRTFQVDPRPVGI